MLNAEKYEDVPLENSPSCMNKQEDDVLSFISTSPKLDLFEGKNIDSPFFIDEKEFEIKDFLLQELSEQEKTMNTQSSPASLEEGSKRSLTIEKDEKVPPKSENKSKFCKNYSILVDSILIPNKNSAKSLPFRRDVVNKKILRAFKKFICNLFVT